MESDEKRMVVIAILCIKSDEICTGGNLKITQHDPGFENANEGDNGEHLESTHFPPLALNVANKNSCICHSNNLLQGHERSWPCYLFDPHDNDCTIQRRIINRCDQVYLQTLGHIQELYTYPCDINTNRIIFIGRLMWIVTPGKEENQIHTLTTNVKKGNQLLVVIIVEIFSFAFAIKQA